MQNLLNKEVQLIVLDHPEPSQPLKGEVKQFRYTGTLCEIKTGMICIKNCVRKSFNLGGDQQMGIKWFNTNSSAFVSIGQEY